MPRVMDFDLTRKDVPKITIDLVKIFRHLDSPDYPANMMCTHHGICFRWHRCSVGVTQYHGRLLITCYRRGTGFRLSRHKKVMSEMLRAVRIALDDKAKVRETWNGLEGHDGVSVVFNIECPKPLKEAINRYIGLENNVWKITDKERGMFERWERWIAPVLPDDPEETGR